MDTSLRLTKHQADAIALFPEDGWHAVDFHGITTNDTVEFRMQVLRPMFTAEILESKGYLESRIQGDITNPFGLWTEYKKVKGDMPRK